AVKAHLNFEEVSQHSESGTPSGKRDLRKRLGSRRVRSVSGSPELRRGRPESPRKKDLERKMVFKRPKRVYSTGLETRRIVCLHTRMTQGVNRTIAVAGILRVVTKAPALEEQSLLLRNTITKEHPHTGRKLCRKAKVVQEDTGSQGQKGKSQALKMTIYPSHGYARILIRSLLAFVISISQKGPVCQVMSKHMTEARIQKIISKSFRQRQKWNDGQCQHGAICSIPHLLDSPGKKCIKDPVEIHHIKQRERESTEDFVCRFKIESRDVKGAPEIMRISGFMHGMTNPELIKRLHDKISKSIDEMIRITKSFLRGRWQPDRFTLLSKSPKEIMALEKGKFKAPPPMTTTVKKRNNNKFCEFHGEVGHNTDECMHLKRQIEELLKNGKLSHVIKELKQSSGKDQPKANKKGETSNKDKALTILMVQLWQSVARQRIT
ncbi:hypothetical protein Tco_1071737, partial [Tanacetum coccineum]